MKKEFVDDGTWIDFQTAASRYGWPPAIFNQWAREGLIETSPISLNGRQFDVIKVSSLEDHFKQIEERG